jgi:O-methyltransferase involved in polyketide biosynthesis
MENLVKAGFDPRMPAFFLWERVTYYLSREAMESTFLTIAANAPYSGATRSSYALHVFYACEPSEELW